jgi:hypothetical protein
MDHGGAVSGLRKTSRPWEQDTSSVRDFVQVNCSTVFLAITCPPMHFHGHVLYMLGINMYRSSPEHWQGTKGIPRSNDRDRSPSCLVILTHSPMVPFIEPTADHGALRRWKGVTYMASSHMAMHALLSMSNHNNGIRIDIMKRMTDEKQLPQV